MHLHIDDSPSVFTEHPELDGIGVTLVAPGLIDTPFYDAYPAGIPDAPSLGPEAIAEMIVWALGQPAGVDVNTLVVRPIGQAI